MPLDEGTRVVVREWVGSRSPTDDELDAVFDRLRPDYDDDRTAGLATALETLRIRRATLLSGPTSFSIAGEYSESNAGNLDSLTRLISSLEAELGVTVGNVVTVVPATVRPR